MTYVVSEIDFVVFQSPFFAIRTVCVSYKEKLVLRVALYCCNVNDIDILLLVWHTAYI